MRFSLIDSLRGFAIAGILFVNIPDMVGLGYGLQGGSGDVTGAQPLEFLVQTRFVPIFTFLFGVSMFFILRGALDRGRRPWPALLVRIVALFTIGLLHSLIYPGEILREYAIVALVMLPMVLFVPRHVQLSVGAVLLAAAYLITGGGLASTPGLMLLGAATAAYGLPKALEANTRATRIAFGVLTVVLIPALLWQATVPGDPRFSTPGAVAGLVMAAWYIAGFSLLWHTPARRPIAAVFDPIGRMALSNYVGASVVVFSVNLSLDFSTIDTVAPTVVLAVGILSAQSVASRLWLRHFRYGPLEWAWRIATWRRVVPIRRTTADQLATPESMARTSS